MIEQLARELEGVKAALAEAMRTIASLEARSASLESALVNTAAERDVLARRLYGPKTERQQTSELQLTLGGLLEEQKRLQRELDALRPKLGEGDADGDGGEGDGARDDDERPRPKPKGRRDLRASSLPVTTVELLDPELERTGRRIGFEEARQLMYVRGGFRVLVRRVAKYEVELHGEPRALCQPSPPSLFPKALAHGSLIAHLAIQKFVLDVPHHRYEQFVMTAGHERLDRATMGRYMEQLGNTLGATVVTAMLDDARTTCAVLSTDATGALIQPGKKDGPMKRGCKKGHFFTIVADARHVLFVYAERHSSDFVAKLFAGFRGFLQCDASSVYDILERGPPSADTESAIQLVGCWAHCRRYFFEAAVTGSPIGVEGLTYIQNIYHADKPLAELAPAARKAKRGELVAPLMQAFFTWVDLRREEPRPRSLASRALGYAHNQEVELRRVLLDGRLPLDNTRSERQNRVPVVGRKNWLFYGSDLHAESAAAILSVVASCRMHRVDPEEYLENLIRLLPYWPADRYLELAPVHWLATRARLDPEELAAHAGPFTVPPPKEPPAA